MSTRLIDMLETKRLKLRPFKESDLDDLYEYLSQITIHCFMEMKVSNKEEAKIAFEERLKDQDGLYLAIELKENHKVIGEIFAMSESVTPDGKDLDTYSPCWMLNDDYKRQGIMYEAAIAYFDHLFKIGARRIYTYTEDYNIACQKLCKKLGMRQEGFYKEFVFFVNDELGNPIYENTYEFAILKKEWDDLCKMKA